MKAMMSCRRTKIRISKWHITKATGFRNTAMLVEIRDEIHTPVTQLVEKEERHAKNDQDR